MDKDLNFGEIFKNIVDYLAPLQTPTEQAVYYYLIRHSILINKHYALVGERSMAKKISASAKGKLATSPGVSPGTVGRCIKDLVNKKHIKIISVGQKGKEIKVYLPSQIEECISLMSKQDGLEDIIDYYKDPNGRLKIFERDEWTCSYCGEALNKNNAVLDHYFPQHLGGDNSMENLKSACVLCNSHKSGKTYEEAAMAILKSIKDRNINR